MNLNKALGSLFRRMMRSLVIFRDTQFTSVAFFPTGVQFLTVGTDRKIGFWQVLDGSLIREIEGSVYDALNTVAVSHNGCAFVSGGCDQLVKLWKYNEGCLSHVGVGHAGAITAAKFSPDDRYIVSVSSDGGIFKWKCPGAGGSGGPTAPGTCSLKMVVNDRGDSKQNEDIHRTRENTPLTVSSHRCDAGKKEPVQQVESKQSTSTKPSPNQ
ncbi:Transcription initiation factor TFIID subunit 5 [Gryllus bimaculatus]|nr:Transcription initiation factor TFIID subunit 5 [Gryllus bimaculatus]